MTNLDIMKYSWSLLAEVLKMYFLQNSAQYSIAELVNVICHFQMASMNYYNKELIYTIQITMYSVLSYNMFVYPCQLCLSLRVKNCIYRGYETSVSGMQLGFQQVDKATVANAG